MSGRGLQNKRPFWLSIVQNQVSTLNLGVRADWLLLASDGMAVLFEPPGISDIVLNILMSLKCGRLLENVLKTNHIQQLGGFPQLKL